MADLKQWFRSGHPWIWLTSGAVSLSLLAVLGLIALLAVRGLGYFWPAGIVQWQVKQQDGTQTQLIGEIYADEWIQTQRLIESGVAVTNSQAEETQRFLIKTGNREYNPTDFYWVLAPDIVEQTKPENVAVFERVRHGSFYGFVSAIQQDGKLVSQPEAPQLQALLQRTVELNEQIAYLQNKQIASVNYQLEELRLKKKALKLEQGLTADKVEELGQQQKQLELEYSQLEQNLFALRKMAARDQVLVVDMSGQTQTLPLADILTISYPNRMNLWDKLSYFVSRLIGFVSEDPREANTEGGVFPAIFGTVFMVMLMAVIVTPFGVVAAIYLHEYAHKGFITKLIRIAVVNLAGVPSIVYGVFGLGFLVYMLGGSIDKLFYPEALPSPTFGTPGVIWSAITLAILTLPVVIVSTEEGLSRIPVSMRNASMALGATRAETLWRVILPMASPAIMTGLILAIARAAGEVAPLMLVGVVKSAPMLPIDGNFPYVHLERKFMHLGFHIYDVGFQSPNVEAARPLVYATALLLVTVIVSLNITAIAIRNHLRNKYQALQY